MKDDPAPTKSVPKRKWIIPLCLTATIAMLTIPPVVIERYESSNRGRNVTRETEQGFLDVFSWGKRIGHVRPDWPRLTLLLVLANSAVILLTSAGPPLYKPVLKVVSDHRAWCIACLVTSLVTSVAVAWHHVVLTVQLEHALSNQRTETDSYRVQSVALQKRLTALESHPALKEYRFDPDAFLRARGAAR